MNELLEYTGALVVVRCWCGIQHGIPDSLNRTTNRNPNQEVFCPVGHKWFRSGPSAAEKRAAQLEVDLQRERQRLDQAKAESRELTRKLNAEKSAKSRIKNRVANGVCPCCNRTFVNLGRHMQTKHADFVAK